MYCMYVVYLPNVETVMAANHCPGHETGRGRGGERREGTRGRWKGDLGELCDLGRPLISVERAKFG